MEWEWKGVWGWWRWAWCRGGYEGAHLVDCAAWHVEHVARLQDDVEDAVAKAGLR